jgi:formate hydrogenlyase subunit 3/multisubunit Na+/H+ antiporter MnhD subunit
LSWLAAAAAFWIGGAVVSGLLRGRSPSVVLAVGATVAGAVCLAIAALQTLSGPSEAWEYPGALLFGPIALLLDPIAAVFLAPIALIGALGAIYAPAYARLGHGKEKLGGELVALALLLTAMALVVVAANMMLFLVGWEMMTLASWALVSHDHQDRSVRAAGLNYLVAGHVSGGALALLFAMLAQASDGWRIPAAPFMAGAGGVPPVAALMVLALIGFGTKAALAPFHVWLPDAHAAAPSHVSALMSGVLVTLGFYGLVRFLPLFGPLPRAWSMTIMVLGALGACGGIVMALSQTDVKRMLAYSTIENAGLITLGIGGGLVATAAGQPLVAALAWSAALLHVWNHAIAKALLFLTAGAIAELAGSRDLERWGGLLRRLPLLGTTLMIGAAALVGLPGTHGFASEWLLLMSLLRGSQGLTGSERVLMPVAVGAVAFTAGIALACFVRLVGVGLLGHPRSASAATARSPAAPALAFPIVLLAGSCLALVAALGPMLGGILSAVEQLVPGAPLDRVREIAAPLPWLAALLPTAAVLFGLYRAWVRRRRVIRQAVTWDCGFARPDASMQYTASSLAQPITRVLQPALRSAVHWREPEGLWPSAMSWESRTPERALAEFYRPAFRRIAELLGLFRRLQEGRVMVYLRYVGLALLVLLIWFFWPSGAPR